MCGPIEVLQGVSAVFGLMKGMDGGDAPAPAEAPAAPAAPEAPKSVAQPQSASAPDEAARRQTAATAQQSAKGGGATGMGGTLLTGPAGVAPDLLNLGRAGKNAKLGGATLLG